MAIGADAERGLHLPQKANRRVGGTNDSDKLEDNIQTLYLKSDAARHMPTISDRCWDKKLGEKSHLLSKPMIQRPLSTSRCV